MRRNVRFVTRCRSIAATVGLGLVLAGCGGGSDATGTASTTASGGSAAEIPGVVTYGDLTRNHVTSSVSYPQTPPVGGDHSPHLQTCGAYVQPVPDELGVHSMEHGAVWLTYRPDLPAAQVDLLRHQARQAYVLVSPHPGLPAPVVASAWGRQLLLDSASDSRLQQFVAAFRQGPQTPEPGAACQDLGTPLAELP